jgi:hypothetical protein
LSDGNFIGAVSFFQMRVQRPAGREEVRAPPGLTADHKNNHHVQVVRIPRAGDATWLGGVTAVTKNGVSYFSGWTMIWWS